MATAPRATQNRPRRSRVAPHPEPSPCRPPPAPRLRLAQEFFDGRVQALVAKVLEADDAPPVEDEHLREPLDVPPPHERAALAVPPAAPGDLALADRLLQGLFPGVGVHAHGRKRPVLQ